MAVKPHDPERQAHIDRQADWIAKAIEVDPEKVMTDGNYGVSLTPDQLDALIFACRKMGVQDAIDLLRSTGHITLAQELEESIK